MAVQKFVDYGRIIRDLAAEEERRRNSTLEKVKRVIRIVLLCTVFLPFTVAHVLIVLTMDLLSWLMNGES